MSIRFICDILVTYKEYLVFFILILTASSIIVYSEDVMAFYNLSFVPISSIENNVGELTLFETPNSMTSVVIEEKTYALVTAINSHAVHIIDISTPANLDPITVMHEDTGFTEFFSPSKVKTVVIDGSTYALVTNSQGQSIIIIDISDPTSPVEITIIDEDDTDDFQSPTSITIVVVGDSTYAFVGNEIGDNVMVIDISDPEFPEIKTVIHDQTRSAGSEYADSPFTMLNAVFDLTSIIIDGKPYVLAAAIDDGGFQIIDISDPSNPTPASEVRSTSYQGGTFDNMSEIRGIATAVIDSVPYAIVISTDDSALNIINISDPTAPSQIVSLVNEELFGNDTYEIITMVLDDKTYALSTSYDNDYTHIIDISTPSSPIIVDSILDNESLKLKAPHAIMYEVINNVPYVFVTSEDEDAIQILEINYTELEVIPDPPTNFIATPGDTIVSLSWTAPFDGGAAITDYLVEFDDGFGWETFDDGISTTPTAIVTDLFNGQPYDFRVSAINSVGTGPLSDVETATPATLPDAPTALIATAGDTIVSLTWTAPVNDGGSPIIHYVVAISEDGGTTWNRFLDNLSDTTSKIVPDLTNGQPYTFGVYAHNSVGTGFDYVTVTATPLAPPPILDEDIVELVIPSVIPSSGGSSGETTPPSFTTSFDEGTETIFINGIGIAPESYQLSSIMDEPIIVQTGIPIPISITLYENISWEYITYMEICINKQILNNIVCDTDTVIIWDKDESDIITIDPHGIIDNVSLEIIKVDSNVATFNYNITFASPMDTSFIQIHSWDNKRNDVTYTLEHALTVVQGSYILFEDTIKVRDTPETIDTLETIETTQNDTSIQSVTITNEEQMDTIKQWAGFAELSATDKDVYEILDILNPSETYIPKWVKDDLGLWVIKNKISIDEFKDALTYIAYS